MPALLTRTSTGPSASTARGDRGLVGHVERRRDRALDPAATASHASAVRPLIATRAPAPASARASASPIPRVDPVTSAVRPGQVEEAHSPTTGSTTCEG